MIQPDLLKWRESRGEKPATGLTVATKYLYPLIFEPGTSWVYGAGHDWAGKMIERVNPGMTLETYFEKYIWRPLGIKDMTFFVDKRHDLKVRKAGVSIREAPGQKVTPYSGPLPYEGMEDCMGGEGLAACLSEYLKVQHSLLADDEKLLKKESVVELFTPQLTEMSQKALMKLLENPDMNNIFGSTLPTDCRKSWGLGGLINLDNLAGWKSAGTMTWSGMPNLCWVSFPLSSDMECMTDRMLVVH